MPSATTPSTVWKRRLGQFALGGVTGAVSVLFGGYLSLTIFGVDWERHSTGFSGFVETMACVVVAAVMWMTLWLLVVIGYHRRLRRL